MYKKQTNSSLLLSPPPTTAIYLLSRHKPAAIMLYAYRTVDSHQRNRINIAPPAFLPHSSRASNLGERVRPLEEDLSLQDLLLDPVRKQGQKAAGEKPAGHCSLRVTFQKRYSHPTVEETTTTWRDTQNMRYRT